MLFTIRFKIFFVQVIFQLVGFYSYTQSIDLSFKDGSSYTINLIDCKKITFQGNEITLQLLNSNDASNISVVDHLKFRDSGILNIEEEAQQYSGIVSVLLVPNPCTSEFSFNIPSCNLENTEMELNDLKGSKVSCNFRELNGQFTCDISSLTDGVYILKIYVGGEVITQKILKI